MTQLQFIQPQATQFQAPLLNTKQKNDEGGC